MTALSISGPGELVGVATRATASVLTTRGLASTAGVTSRGLTSVVASGGSTSTVIVTTRGPASMVGVVSGDVASAIGVGAERLHAREHAFERGSLIA